MSGKKFPFKNLFSSISIQEKINFARHLSVTTKSGIPILEGLKLIQNQSNSKRLSRVIDSLIKDVNNGQSLAQALERFNHIFDDLFINMVKLGETSGNLSQTLLHLSNDLKKQKEVNHKIKSALIYPAVILVVTLGITIFLTVFIFPKILPIFVSLRIQLPPTTKLLIQILTFLSNYGIHILIGLVFLIVIVKIILGIKVVHFWFDRLILFIPIVKKLIVGITLTSFARSMSVLLKSGMNLVDALEIGGNTFHNFYYRSQIEKLIETVKKGEEMAHYMSREPKLFPPMFVGMIRVGESTGNLEENMTYLADYYESEVDETLKNLTTVVEPLLLVIMGLLVGFVALSIITPIYKITQEIKIR